MRGFVLYVVTGFFATVALVFVAPPELFGVGAKPVAQESVIIQSVDRAHKGNRLIPSTIGKSQVPQNSPTFLVGCEPVISPLSASAKANFPGLCTT
jgi:hypothetical protein